MTDFLNNQPIRQIVYAWTKRISQFFSKYFNGLKHKSGNIININFVDRGKALKPINNKNKKL